MILFNCFREIWYVIIKESLSTKRSIVCFPSCDVKNFEINLIFLIKPFFYMTKKSKQKFKYLENERRF